MMNTTNCTTDVAHCTQCGSANLEDVTTGDQGYSACCNEPVSHGICFDSHPDVYGQAVRNYAAKNPAIERRIRNYAAKKPAAKPASSKPAPMSHANCSHESTPAARRACRASRKA